MPWRSYAPRSPASGRRTRWSYPISRSGLLPEHHADRPARPDQPWPAVDAEAAYNMVETLWLEWLAYEIGQTQTWDGLLHPDSQGRPYPASLVDWARPLPDGMLTLDVWLAPHPHALWGSTQNDHVYVIIEGRCACSGPRIALTRRASVDVRPRRGWYQPRVGKTSARSPAAISPVSPLRTARAPSTITYARKLASASRPMVIGPT